MFDMNVLLNGGKASVNGGGFDDIKFVGFLVATPAPKTHDGKPFYFTVDMDGKAISGFQERYALGSLGFNLVTKPFPTVESKDLVEVVRYFRPTTDTGTTHNMGGMTAICELNYEDMLITVYPSFCMECDNFEKSLGLHYARKNQDENLGFVVTLDRTMSIQENIYYGLSMDLVSFLNEESFKAFRSPLIRSLGTYLN